MVLPNLLESLIASSNYKAHDKLETQAILGGARLHGTRLQIDQVAATMASIASAGHNDGVDESDSTLSVSFGPFAKSKKKKMNSAPAGARSKHLSPHPFSSSYRASTSRGGRGSNTSGVTFTPPPFTVNAAKNAALSSEPSISPAFRSAARGTVWAQQFGSLGLYKDPSKLLAPGSSETSTTSTTALSTSSGIASSSTSISSNGLSLLADLSALEERTPPTITGRRHPGNPIFDKNAGTQQGTAYSRSSTSSHSSAIASAMPTPKPVSKVRPTVSVLQAKGGQTAIVDVTAPPPSSTIKTMPTSMPFRKVKPTIKTMPKSMPLRKVKPTVAAPPAKKQGSNPIVHVTRPMKSFAVPITVAIVPITLPKVHIPTSNSNPIQKATLAKIIENRPTIANEDATLGMANRSGGERAEVSGFTRKASSTLENGQSKKRKATGTEGRPGGDETKNGGDEVSPALLARAAAKVDGRKMNGFTKSDDELVIRAVASLGKNWHLISTKCFCGRLTPTQIRVRYAKQLDPELSKGHFSKEEDELIRQMVSKGLTWKEIAAKLPGRRLTERVRYRWTNALQPGLKRGTWSNEEIKRLDFYHQLYGNEWKKIAEFLPGRSEASVKNRWHNSKNARAKDAGDGK